MLYTPFPSVSPYGTAVEPCERAAGEHRGPWAVRTVHQPTGLLLNGDQCPHFSTLADARRFCRDLKRSDDLLAS